MKMYTADKIRNVALLGHSSSGKSTFAEAALFLTGCSERMGRSADGTLAMDFDPEERKRKISVSTAICSVEHDGYKLNLIDAPGLFDFKAGVHEAVRAADSALIVLSGKSGLNVGSVQAYESCADRDIPVSFFIGKLDSPNAAFNKVLNSLTTKYGAAICPVTVPFFSDNKPVGYVNLVTGKAYTYSDGKRSDVEMPDHDDVVNMKTLLIEAVASQDESLMEKYFDGLELTADEIVSGMRKGIDNHEIIPVFCGAQQICEGVDLALEMIEMLMPAADESDEYSADGKTAAIVFKTIVDPFVGKMSLLKVVDGEVSSSSKLINARTGSEVRIGKTVALRAGRQEDIDKLVAGDIGAVAKLGDVKTGDTLCDASSDTVLDGVTYPAPCLSMAVFPVNKGDEEKIATGLYKLMDEDPTISFKLNEETGEQILSGLGESHLDIISSKLKSKFGVEMRLEVPRIAYRETIRKKVRVQGRYKKQSGGHGQFGDVWIEFEPYDGVDMMFEEKIFGGAVPKNYFPAVQKGLEDSVHKGVLAGYPVIGLKATLVDGSYHPVDSSEMAFRTAAQLAYKSGLEQADPILLEPIGTLVAVVPDDLMGDVIGDINKRRGRILGMNPAEDKMSVITAEVPIGEMHDFSTVMRSITQGRTTFTLEFARYEEMPSNMAQKVIDESEA